MNDFQALESIGSKKNNEITFFILIAAGRDGDAFAFSAVNAVDNDLTLPGASIVGCFRSTRRSI